MINIKNIISMRNQIDYSKLEDMIEIDDVNRAVLQKTLLQMYTDILEVCKEIRVVPYLVGGSALGAYRHNGFIPWDDDLDFAMTRKDYNKFIQCFNDKLGGKYVLSAPNHSRKPKARFAKIMKKDTIFRQIGDNSPKKQCGIFIDLFVLDNVPDNKILRMVKGGFCNIIEFISGQVWLSERKTSLDNGQGIIWSIRKTIGYMFSFLYSYEWFDLIDKSIRYKNNESTYCSIATGRKHYFGEMIRRDDIFPARYVQFCNIKAPVFNNVEKYLETLYGNDYMQIPPESKREKHYIKELKF